MSKSVFVGNTPKINLDKVGGDLSIVGWDGADLLIKGDEGEIRFEQTEGSCFSFLWHDLSLRIPKGATLELSQSVVMLQSVA